MTHAGRSPDIPARSLEGRQSSPANGWNTVTRAAAFAVEQDLIGELPEPVGNQPFEIYTFLRPTQPD